MNRRALLAGLLGAASAPALARVLYDPSLDIRALMDVQLAASERELMWRMSDLLYGDGSPARLYGLRALLPDDWSPGDYDDDEDDEPVDQERVWRDNAARYFDLDDD